MSSEVRIYFNPLDASSQVRYDVEPGRQIIDFLQEHYPVGFDGHMVAFAGSVHIEIDDLDYEIKDNELITILVMPGAAAAAYVVGYLGAVNWGAVALKLAVSVALSYAVSLIFKPSAPPGFQTEEQSPIYSLNPTRNAARLGQPIASHYGDVSFPPDFATAPYQYFNNPSNDQYVDQLMCLGHGEFAIDEIYIGDTPFSEIESGAIKYWVYGPDDHQSTFGVISADVWEHVKNTEAPRHFNENVFTSPEIDNWEFNESLTEAVSVWTAFAGSAFAAGNDATTGAWILAHIADVDYVADIDDVYPFYTGDTIELQGTVSNNVTFTIGSIVVDELDPLKVTLFQKWGDTSVLSDEDPLPGATEYKLNEAGTPSTNMTAGPYRAQKLGQTVRNVFVDIQFPRGLYKVDGSSGKIKYRSVTFRIIHQRIDELTGAPIGLPVENTWTINQNYREILRRTYNSGALIEGAYEVTVIRDTPVSDDSREVDAMQWVGMKSFIVTDQTVGAVYGDVTLMAIRMKATNGLGQAARSRIRVKARRINLPDGESDNPITVIRDIFKNTTYGLGRPETELYSDELDYLQDLWDDIGPYFNGSFADKGTGFEAMQNVASLAGARLVQDGGLVTVIPDITQPVRKALYSTANIVRGSLSLDYTFDTSDDFNGVQVEYRDPLTFQAKYAYYPVSPEPTIPDTYILFGSTDETYATQFANYLWNVRAKRRKLVRIETELEGLIPRFGDRIGVAHPIYGYGQSGVVVDVLDSQTIKVDQDLDWTTDNILMLRDDTGEQLGPYDVTQGDSPNIVTSTSNLPAYGPEGRDPTSYMFGKADAIIQDFMVTRISPKSDITLQIEGQLYDAEIYDGGPPHMGPVLCNVYNCDALDSAIGVIGAEYHWPFDQGGATPSLGSNDSIIAKTGGVNLQVTEPYDENFPEQPMFFDQCGGKWGWGVQDTGGGQSQRNFLGDTGQTISGDFSWGMLVSPGGSSSVWTFDLTDDSEPSNPQITTWYVQASGAGFLVGGDFQAGDPTIFADVLDISRPIFLHAVYIHSGTWPEFGASVNCYANGKLVGTKTGVRSLRKVGQKLGRIIHTQSNNSTTLHAFIGGPTTTTKNAVNEIKKGFETNFENYVDQNPNCIPP